MSRGLFDTPGATQAVREARAVRMLYGKHKDRTLGEIADRDLLYLDWLVGTDIRSEYLRQAVLTLCGAYANEIAARVEERE